MLTSVEMGKPTFFRFKKDLSILSLPLYPQEMPTPFLFDIQDKYEWL